MTGNKRNSPANRSLDVQKQPRKEWEEYSREERMTNEVASIGPTEEQSGRSRVKNNKMETGGH